MNGIDDPELSYKELMRFLNSENMKKTVRGTLKQVTITGGCLVVPSLLFGPVGGAVGGIIGSVASLRCVEDGGHDGVLRLLSDLDPDTRNVS